MAFDMYCGDQQSSIEHHEDHFLFQVAESLERYPKMTSLVHRYYESPVIYPDEANTIVHELIALLAEHQNDKALTQWILRLLPFFSQAYCQDEMIRCASD